MKECAGAVSILADKRSEGSQMDETLKLRWLCCPRCGGKTRTQIRTHTVLEDFPLFCPKCKYTCVIRFKDGKMGKLQVQKRQKNAICRLQHFDIKQIFTKKLIFCERGFLQESVLFCKCSAYENPLNFIIKVSLLQ